MRLEVLVLTVILAATTAAADPISLAAPNPSFNGDRWLFRYDIPEPRLAAGTKIAGLTLNTSVQATAVGRNTSPGPTALAGILTPKNPLEVPLPDCARTPKECELKPQVLGGVDPKNLKTASDQFFLNRETSAVTKGAEANVAGDPLNLKGPQAGSTVRTDAVSLIFDASPPIGFFPTRIDGKDVNALTFGGTLQYARGSFTNARKKTVSLPAKNTLGKSVWNIDDDTTVPAKLVPHASAMGLDQLDPNGILVAGLFFAYTNEGTEVVDLSELIFATSPTEIPIEDLGLAGTLLLNPDVTLNGLAQPVQSRYRIAPGATLEFLFPGTTDPFFIVHGDVSIGSEPQFRFAYEGRVLPVAAVPAWVVFISGGVLLAGAGVLTSLCSKAETRRSAPRRYRLAASHRGASG